MGSVGGFVGDGYDVVPVVLEILCRLDLGPAHIDIGKLTSNFMADHEGLSLPAYIERECTQILGRHDTVTHEPRDVVIYGFGRIGRLLTRLLVEKAAGGQNLVQRAVVLRPPKNPIDDLYKLLDDLSSTTLLSLDELTYGSNDDKPVPLVDTLQSQDKSDALTDLEREEMRNLLVDSIGLLTEQERLVIALYYYEELTLKEIGQVMELSESRVSQIHTKAVLSLRGKLRMRLLQ